MYLPEHFRESNITVLQDCITNHPFGTLISNGNCGIDANHIPFEPTWEEGEKGILRAHIARANPLWKDVNNGDEVLVVFQAGNAYVSPNWYPSKHETHKQVPTWNYIVVHARGRITFTDDKKFLRALVGKLTRTHESSQVTPWKMADAPRDFIDSLLERIIGIQIEITQIIGKSKLGQDEEVRDIIGAGNNLKCGAGKKIGEAMIKQLKENN